MKIKSKWHLLELEEIFDIKTAKSQKDFIVDQGKYFIIDMGGVSSTGHLIEKKMANKAEHMLEINDLVMPKDDMGHGHILGKVAIIRESDKYVLGDHVFKLRNTSKNNPEFLRILINSNKINKSIKRIANGTSQQGLRKSDLSKHLLPIPSIDTQNRIVKIISPWNEVIDKQIQLIEALEERLKGLIQISLNKPQNPSGWQKFKLGEIGEFRSAGVDKKIIMGQNKVLLINYMDVFRKDFINKEMISHEVTANEHQRKMCAVKKGDVLFTPSSEIKGDIAHSAVILEDIKNAVYSYHLFRYRISEKWYLPYKAFAFKVSNFYKQASNICQGSGQRYTLSMEDFKKFELLVPPFNVQQKIADKLHSCQIEIDKRKILLKAYKNQRQWVIQQLFSH